jgi:hypothetical protein
MDGTAALTMAKASEMQFATEVQVLTISAQPNPTTQYFTLVMNGGTDQPLTLRVTDVLGRMIETRRNIASGGSVRIGEQYRPGIYYAEVMQGSERKILKLIKQ